MDNKITKDTVNTPKDISDGYDIKDFNEIISTSLDMLGYSEEMVQYRRDMNHISDNKT